MQYLASPPPRRCCAPRGWSQFSAAASASHVCPRRTVSGTSDRCLHRRRQRPDRHGAVPPAGRRLAGRWSARPRAGAMWRRLRRSASARCWSTSTIAMHWSRRSSRPRPRRGASAHRPAQGLPAPMRWRRRVRALPRIRSRHGQSGARGAARAGAARIVAQSIAFAYAPGGEPHDESRAAGRRRVVFGRPARGTGDGSGLEAVVLRYGRLYGPNTRAAAPGGRRCMSRQRPMRRDAP